MTIVVAILLAILVAIVWLACLGFARLPTPLDRLHCVAYVNAAAGLALIALGFATDGLSPRALKIVMIAAINLLAGAALSHAIGRGLVNRARHLPQESPP